MQSQEIEKKVVDDIQYMAIGSSISSYIIIYKITNINMTINFKFLHKIKLPNNVTYIIFFKYIFTNM